MDRAGYIIEYQIRERDVLIARALIALKLNRASIDLVQHAIRNSYVLRKAATEPEDRPAGAEDAVGDGHELAAAEQGACIILREHDAVTYSQILGADEVEAVIIPIHAIVDVDAVHVHPLALNDAEAVIGAIE